MFSEKKKVRLARACVASVSIGFSAGLKHFSVFGRAKIGAIAKKLQEEGGEGREGKSCPQTQRF